MLSAILVAIAVTVASLSGGALAASTNSVSGSGPLSASPGTASATATSGSTDSVSPSGPL
jgi:hypothetical protein